MLKHLIACALVAAAALSSAFASPAFAVQPYKIASQDGADDRLRITVRLEARQSPADLKAIFDNVRARLPAAKRVAKMAFYLPLMELSAKPWAVIDGENGTAEIFGLRLDEETAYRAEISSDKRVRIGAWLTSPPALPGRLVIYKSGGKLFAEWLLRNGQKTTDEVVERRTRAGRRFDVAGGDGSYFSLDGKGNLELGSGATAIALAEPVVPLPQAEPRAVAGHGIAPPAQAASATGDRHSDVPVAATPAPQVATVSGTAAGTVPPAQADDKKAQRKRAFHARSKQSDGSLRRADAAGDAIQRALSQ